MSQTKNTKKGSKCNHSKDEQRKEVAVAGPSREVTPPKIFKLTIDCFDEIFEYLSMKDLHSMGQTCKTMQQVAGEYFKQNYSAAEKFCSQDGIYTVHSSNDGVVNERIYTSGFNEFMPCISHYDEKLTPLRYLQSHINEFKSTNHIYLVGLRINQEKKEFIKNLLPKIEIVQIRNCWMFGNFYELMLKDCVNLKCIYVQNADSSSNSKHEWLLRDYPKLEQLELMPTYSPIIDELNAFFDRNLKVQRFSTSARFLWTNKDGLLKSNAKLDVLEIKEARFYMEDMDNNTATIKTIWDLLNQLHKKGFYKRLFIYTDRIDQNLSIKLNSVPGLELLCIRRFDKSYNLPFLVNLKELIILDGLNATDAQILANGLVKLERLYVDNTTIEDILPFICQLTNLNKIKMFHKNTNEHEYNEYFYNSGDEYGDEDYSDYTVSDEGEEFDQSNNSDGDVNDDNVSLHDHGVEVDEQEEKEQMENVVNNINSDSSEADGNVQNENGNDDVDQAKKKDTLDWRVLNLVAFNKEREKLSRGRKLTIYVRDDVFLATKWAAKNGDINLSLIEMKRSDSFEWNHHY